MQTSTPALTEVIETTVWAKHPRTVAELAQLVSAYEAVYEDEFQAALKQVVSEGAFELSEPSRKIDSTLDYLFTITVSGWFWATMILVVCAIASVAFVPDTFPLNVTRWVLGSVFVLYLPGFTLIQFLFAEKKSLDGLERFALSVGLSLAVVPLIGLILNYLPWGIRLTPIMVSLSIFVLSFAVLAAARKYMMLHEFL